MGKYGDYQRHDELLLKNSKINKTSLSGIIATPGMTPEFTLVFSMSYETQDLDPTPFVCLHNSGTDGNDSDPELEIDFKPMPLDLFPLTSTPFELLFELCYDGPRNAVDTALVVMAGPLTSLALDLVNGGTQVAWTLQIGKYVDTVIVDCDKKFRHFYLPA